jgi:hypothetical protein
MNKSLNTENVNDLRVNVISKLPVDELNAPWNLSSTN